MNKYVVSCLDVGGHEYEKTIDAQNEMAAGFEFIRQHNLNVNSNVVLQIRPVAFVGGHVAVMCLTSEN